MRDDRRNISPEVIAAHEAGHAVAAIVYGATFEGIKIVREGNAVAQNIGVGGLSQIGYVRTFLAGTAGEEVALGVSDLENSRNDRDQLLALLTDPALLAYADPLAVDLIRKYESGHTAVRDPVEVEPGKFDEHVVVECDHGGVGVLPMRDQSGQPRGLRIHRGLDLDSGQGGADRVCDLGERCVVSLLLARFKPRRRIDEIAQPSFKVGADGLVETRWHRKFARTQLADNCIGQLSHRRHATVDGLREARAEDENPASHRLILSRLRRLRQNRTRLQLMSNRQTGFDIPTTAASHCSGFRRRAAALTARDQRSIVSGSGSGMESSMIQSSR